MKLFKTSIIGMTTGIICIYTGLIALIVSLLLIFGMFVGAGGIYDFFADTGFSCITLSVLGLWFLTLVLIIGGALTAFGFWTAGLVALCRTDVKWYLIPEILVFLLCVMVTWGSLMFFMPALWWGVHFTGWRIISRHENNQSSSLPDSGI